MEGKTPMLNNNGKAYIKTDRKVTVSEGFYADFIIQYAEIDKHFISLNSAPRFYIGHMSQDDTRLSLAITSHHYTKTKYELNKPHKVKTNVCVGECWMDVDDVREVVFNNTDNFECQYPLSLFFQYSIPSASSASHVFVNIGEDKYRFVPFLKDGKYGMLDLMTMQFYGNANTEGEFTYSLE